MDNSPRSNTVLGKDQNTQSLAIGKEIGTFQGKKIVQNREKIIIHLNRPEYLASDQLRFSKSKAENISYGIGLSCRHTQNGLIYIRYWYYHTKPESETPEFVSLSLEFLGIPLKLSMNHDKVARCGEIWWKSSPCLNKWRATKLPNDLHKQEK
jgi:hypothetical protein